MTEHRLSYAALLALALTACATTNTVEIDAGPGDAGPCTLDETRCTGDTLERCGASGAFETVDTCRPGGCSAELELCLVCTPGERRCSADGVEECVDGTAWRAAEQCDASIGATCEVDHCVSACERAAHSFGYEGCEYWPTVTANSTLANDPSFHYAVAVANTAEQRAHVEVTRGSEVIAGVDVEPGALEVIQLPWVNELRGSALVSTIVRSGAYRLTSTVPVVAYQFNALEFENAAGAPSYTNDAALLLPTAALATSYTVSGIPTSASLWQPSPEESARRLGSGGFVSIVATADATTVHVHTRARLAPMSDTFVTHEAGEEITFQLDRGDVVQLITDTRGWATGTMPGSCHDLFGYTDPGDGSTYQACLVDPRWDPSGTTIESDRAVAVFSGHDCANVPYDTFACDHLEEQLTPATTWRREVVATRATPPVGSDTAGYVNVWRITSSTDGNAISFEPEGVHEPVVLTQGQTLSFESDAESFVVRATSPILLAQLLPGASVAMRAGGVPAVNGDPAFGIVAPTEQYRRSYTFLVPPTYVENWANVVAPLAAQGNVQLDGEPIGALSPIGTSRYGSAQVQLSAGVHHLEVVGDGLTSLDRIAGLMVYGYARYTSYLYPGGLALDRVE